MKQRGNGTTLKSKSENRVPVFRHALQIEIVE
jgi:hypothetical protein